MSKTAKERLGKYLILLKELDQQTYQKYYQKFWMIITQTLGIKITNLIWRDQNFFWDKLKIMTQDNEFHTVRFKNQINSKEMEVLIERVNELQQKLQDNFSIKIINVKTSGVIIIFKLK